MPGKLQNRGQIGFGKHEEKAALSRTHSKTLRFFECGMERDSVMECARESAAFGRLSYMLYRTRLWPRSITETSLQFRLCQLPGEFAP